MKSQLIWYIVNLAIALILCSNYTYAQEIDSLSKSIQLIEKADKTQFDIEIPTFGKVKSASYIKDDHLYLFLNKKVVIKEKELSNLLKDNKYLTKIQIFYPNPEATLFIFSLTENYKDFECLDIMTNLDRVIFSFSTQLRFQTGKDQEINMQVQYNTLPTAKVKLIIKEEPEIYDYIDPYTGNKVFVVPLDNDKMYLPDNHLFIDFELLQSIQGAFIIAHADNIKVEAVIDSVEISGSSVDHIAPKIYSTFNGTDNKKHSLSLLQLKKFMITNRNSAEFFQQMWRDLVQNKKEEYDYQLEIAVTYLTNQLYREAAETITDLQLHDSIFKEDLNTLIAQTIACFMIDEYKCASEAVTQIEISNVDFEYRQEIRLWKEMISYIEGANQNITIGTDLSALFQNMDKNFLSEYPDSIREKLIIKIMEYFIDLKDNDNAHIIYQVLYQNLDNLSRYSRNRFYYNAALLFQNMKDYNQANQYWQRCKEDLLDSKNYAYCRFEELRGKYERSKTLTTSTEKDQNALEEIGLDSYLNDQDYMNELYIIAMLWRGDDLEPQIMDIIGDLHYRNNELIKALYAWDIIDNYYPLNPYALSVNQKMAKAFTEIFTIENKAEPYDLISTFYQFQKLLPIGEQGDDLVLKFTDLLLRLELTNSAINNLRHLINNRLEGMKRQLAINHLLEVYDIEKRYQAIIEVLEKESYDEIPEAIIKPRLKIHAKAFLKLDNESRALALLVHDQSQATDEILADFYWQKKRWKEMLYYSEPYLYSIANLETTILTQSDIIKVIRQANAYLMLQKNELLSDLYLTFIDRIPTDNRYYKVLKALYQLSIDANISDDIIQSLRDGKIFNIKGE